MSTLSPVIWSILPLVSSLFGVGLAWRILPKNPLKTRADLLMNLVKDSLSIFARRSSSSMLQMVIYTSIVLYFFASIFKTTFLINQVFAVFLGASLMIISTLFNLNFIPKMTAKTIQSSKTYFHPGAQAVLNTCSAMSFTTYGLLCLGFIFSFFILEHTSVIGYACGIVLTSVFIRIGGGLFKASSILADDHIAHYEKNIPSHDARNVASLMNISGQIIGNILGFGTDIMGSYIFAITAAVIAILSMLANTPHTDLQQNIGIPFAIMTVGLGTGFIGYGISWLRLKTRYYQNALLEGLYAAIIASGICVFFLFKAQHLSLLTGSNPFFAYVIGLVGAVFIAFSSEFFTSQVYSPAKKIAKQAEYRSVITTLNTLSLGLRSSGLFILYLIVISVLAYLSSGIFGITLATLGMLTTANSIFLASSFTPLASTTEIITAYSEENTSPKNIRKLTKLGKTTFSLGNGLASASAILATMSLFLTLITTKYPHFSVHLYLSLEWLIGIVVGLTLPYLSSGYLLKTLSQLTIQTIQEVTRQFQDIPYLRENKAKPDMLKASDHNTRTSLDAMIIPGLLMALVPIVLGFMYGPKMIIGCALGVFFTTLNQTFYWATTGDVAHSAFSFVKEGHYGGKTSPTFPELNTSENIGIAFKDVLSPSLNIFIKVVTIISSLLMLLLA